MPVTNDVLLKTFDQSHIVLHSNQLIAPPPHLSTITPLASNIGAKIGEGSFGGVYQDMRTPNQVIKITFINQKTLDQLDCSAEYIWDTVHDVKERQVDNKIFQKLFVKIIDIGDLRKTHDDTQYFFETVMEKLDQELKPSSQLGINIDHIKIMLEMVECLLQKRLAYPDFKPSNLMQGNGNLKLIDIDSITSRRSETFFKDNFGEARLLKRYGFRPEDILNAQKWMVEKFVATALYLIDDTTTHNQHDNLESRNTIENSLDQLIHCVYTPSTDTPQIMHAIEQFKQQLSTLEPDK